MAHQFLSGFYWKPQGFTEREMHNQIITHMYKTQFFSYFSSQSEVFLETQHSNNDVERKSSNMAKFLISYVSHVYIQMKIHTLLTYICLAQRWKPTSICENTI